MASAHARNDAETARVIAALRDLHVGKMPRCQAKTGGAEIRNVTRTGMDVDQGRSGRALAICGCQLAGDLRSCVRFVRCDEGPCFPELPRAAKAGVLSVCDRCNRPAEFDKPGGHF